MKIRNLSKLALAVAISSSVVLEGCKKYDDDITRLEQSIEQNKNDIAALKTQLQSLAANNVVESVTAITGGFRIVFKSPTGQSTTYDIVNGAKGDTGATGPQGPAGTPGAPGSAGANGSSPIVTIGQNGNFWISNNGQAAVDTGVKAQGPKGDNGQDGKDGVDGTVVTIVSGTDGKKYWALNGVATTVQAYAGDIAMEETDGGYNVVFTDAKGVSSSLFLAKEQVAITSLTLQPKYTNANIPVVFFPRIVNNLATKTTKLQGWGELTYDLNPYGVNPSFYEQGGLVSVTSQDVIFRSGNASSVNTNFDFVQFSEQGFSNVTARFLPKTASNPITALSTGENLQVAFRVKNTKANASQQYVTSGYTLAKEEIIAQNEVTIEKFAKDSNNKITLSAGVNPTYAGGAYTDDNTATLLALPHSKTTAQNRNNADITLNYKDNASTNLDNNPNFKTVVLDDILKPFYYAAQTSKKTVSFDDNGFSPSQYNLRYSLPTADNHTDVGDWLELDPATGKLSVKISTPNTYNIAAVNNKAYVKVDLFAGSGNAAADLIASRIVRVDIVSTPVTPVDVVGNIDYKMTSAAGTPTIAFVIPKTLDAAYNNVGKTAQDFHAVYSFSSVSSDHAGITWDVASMNNGTQGFARKINIASNVLPGTYTITGKYTSSISADPVVNVTVTVKVGLNNIASLEKEPAFWNANNIIVNGKLISANNWNLEANLWDAWNISGPVSGATIPNVTFGFEILPTIAGISIDGSDNIKLDYTQSTARARVNGTPVKVIAHRYLNGVAYDSQEFFVQFKNPVNAITLKTPYKEFVDKENSGTNISEVDVRRLVSLSDFNGTVIYNYNGITGNTKNTSLISSYGITGISGAFNNYNLTSVTFERYENASGSTISAPSGATGSVVGQNLRWTNSGANLQQPIYLVYKVTVANKWNTTGADVVKEIKIKVNPNN